VRVGFITCSDLSRYFVSDKNPLFTHDDQVAADFLNSHGVSVTPVVWGSPVDLIKSNYDLLIVRSPWDYMDSEEKRIGFFNWLRELDSAGVRLLNSFPVLQWNLDKHYLRDLEEVGIATVPTTFLEPGDPSKLIDNAFARLGRIVVKPCIAAAANDAYLIEKADELAAFQTQFATIRGERAFMIQPFIEEIRSAGEWSLVFLNGEYSHAVLKLPKPGNWLVQDELGGSVQSAEPPMEVREFAEQAYSKLAHLLRARFSEASTLLYARVDVLGMRASSRLEKIDPTSLKIGEVELVEPELFFLDRMTNEANKCALQRFLAGIH
jgi:glutathione synthase/RimK-type ligase-like ATP-grasp enzyme